MKNKGATTAIVLLTIMVAGLLATPAFAAGSTRWTTAPLERSVSVVAPSVSHGSAPLVPTPMTGYPRTVLIETFTGVWCPHCPAEAQSLYQFDQNTSHNVLNIAELHGCEFAPGTGPCGDGYVPPDGSTDARGAFYGLTGYPTVITDGLHP
ncbi:MAG TPA: hypothetical protein VGP88_04795, partial [Thermoplasmata archaeon]|nr:hypothetical protein [Thermoplasmata archaeon]